VEAREKPLAREEEAKEEARRLEVTAPRGP
jgi:hypothetical protein